MKKKKKKQQPKGNIDAYGVSSKAERGKITFSYKTDMGGYDIYDDRDLGETGHP